MVTSSSGATNRVWVDTVSDLNQYKPSSDELEARKIARKSNNKLLAKVGHLLLALDSKDCQFTFLSTSLS